MPIIHIRVSCPIYGNEHYYTNINNTTLYVDG